MEIKNKIKKETIEIAMCFNDYDGNYSLLIETAIVSILENNKKII